MVLCYSKPDKLGQVTARLWLSYWAPSLTLLLTHPEENKLPSFELSCGEAHMTRNWGLQSNNL